MLDRRPVVRIVRSVRRITSLVGEQGREELLNCVVKWMIVIVALVVLLLVATGCDRGSSTPQTVKDLGWTDTVTATYEGQTIWYSPSERHVYGDNCAVTGKATGTVGLPFSGFGATCPNPDYTG